MWARLKKDWTRLRRGSPGARFRDLHEHRRRRPSSTSRAVTISVGVVLILVGVLVGPLPGPGGFVSVFGLALLSTVFRPMARFMDWAELKLRHAWQATARLWRRLPVAGRISLGLGVAAATVALSYGAYRLAMH